MSRLLISVRDRAEALAAIEGGANWIDIKEPGRGALGRADDDAIREIVLAVADRRPISVAMGELNELPQCPCDRKASRWPGAQLIKVGMNNAGPDWPARWLDWRAQIDLRDRPSRAVLVCYADVHSAEEFVAFALSARPAAMLFDTANKDGRSLLNHLPVARIASFLAECEAAGIPVALAGSLDIEAIQTLVPLRPAWIAVRTAACEGGRAGRVSAANVLRLARILSPACPPADVRVPSHPNRTAPEESAWYSDGPADLPLR